MVPAPEGALDPQTVSPAQRLGLLEAEEGRWHIFNRPTKGGRFATGRGPSGLAVCRSTPARGRTDLAASGPGNGRAARLVGGHSEGQGAERVRQVRFQVGGVLDADG